MTHCKSEKRRGRGVSDARHPGGHSGQRLPTRLTSGVGCLLIVLSAAPFLLPSRWALASEQPNVLFVISDDLNCDLGCYGHPFVNSPNLDRLAARGVRFDRAYVQYTICNPSRASFLTGLRPETTRVYSNNLYFRRNLPDVVTLPQLFRQHGYFTASLGKVFHRGLSPDQERSEMDDPRSWDHRFYGEASSLGKTGVGRNLTGDKLAWCRWLAAEGSDQDQHDGQVAAEAIRLMEQHRDRPFFLAVGFYRPHDPFHSPKKYFDQYPLDALPLPQAPDDRTPEVRYALPGGAFREAFDQFTDQERREFLRAYYAGASFVDAQVGRLLETLDRLQLSQRTIVVFIGDHGYELGVRNWWNKNTLFERCCRTPLIIYAPGAAGNGRASRSLVEFVDLYPTLADLCGLTPPSGLAGVSLRNVLEDPSRTVKDAAFTTVLRGNVTGLSVRTDRYRFTEWSGGQEAIELYDHSEDPGEWYNLADDPRSAATRRELAGRLEQFRQAMSPH